MKYYKIIINNPIKDGRKEITINEKTYKEILNIINDKPIIQLGDGVLNTAYIVLIEPDIEYMKNEMLIEEELRKNARAKQLN
jgi:hypothetical protein